MGPLQALSLQVRVDLEVIAKKRYSLLQSSITRISPSDGVVTIGRLFRDLTPL